MRLFAYSYCVRFRHVWVVLFRGRMVHERLGWLLLDGVRIERNTSLCIGSIFDTFRSFLVPSCAPWGHSLVCPCKGWRWGVCVSALTVVCSSFVDLSSVFCAFWTRAEAKSQEKPGVGKNVGCRASTRSLRSIYRLQELVCDDRWHSLFGGYNGGLPARFGWPPSDVLSVTLA